MQARLAGKTAVVTGSAMGFGRAIARRLAQDGARLLLVDRVSADEAAHEIASLGGRAHALTCDVTSQAQVAELAAWIAREATRCDILVNNVGVFESRSFFDLTFEDWRRTMSINLDSMFLMTKAVVDGMVANKWGRIVNIASNTFATGVPNHADYVASKGGVVGFTRALASDLGPHGITVNAVAPGLTKTPGSSRDVFRPRGMSIDEAKDLLIGAQAIKRAESVEDVANAVAFLASDEASFMSGQTMYVDGGLARS